MEKTNKNIIITDESEIQRLNEEFALEDKKIEGKFYTSFTEEKLRTIKTILRKKINCSLDSVRDSLFSLLTNELHPDLNYSDIRSGRFYRSSGKNGKIIFRVETLSNNEFEVVWYAKDQKFVKSIKLSKGIFSDKVTTIRFLSLVKGMNSIENYFEKRLKSIYLQKQKIAFKVTFLKLKIDLGFFNEKRKVSIEKKIARMLDYSKKLY